MKRSLYKQINQQIAPSEALLEATKEKIKAGGRTAARRRQARLAVAAACLVLVCMGAFFAPGFSSVVPTSQTESPSTAPAEEPSASVSDRNQPADGALSYPEEREGVSAVSYNELRFPPSEEPAESSSGALISMDIAEFNESMLAQASALVEGTVTGSYFKDYSYDLPSDKWEENGVLHGETSTLVYQFQITSVLYGEEKLSTGQTILVESRCFNGCYETEKPPFALQDGHTYILPLTNENSLQNIETTSGPVTPEGQYAIVYPFAPQIEKTLDGEYLFHSLWSSLWDESTLSVTFEENFPYALKLRSDKDFLGDLKELIECYH